MQLSALIEAAYELFAPYTIGRTLDVCKACCITDAQEKELVETPLRAVSRTLLQNAYYESARSGSDRELWEMKHFLPRVLELVDGFEFPCHSTEITFTRLDLNQPEKWAAAEVALLQEFALAFFAKCLHCYPLPGGDGLDDILVMFGLAHFELPPLLQAWEDANTPASLQHLAHLLLYGIRLQGWKTDGLTHTFTKPYVDRAVLTWLRNEQVKQKFARQMEHALLESTALSDEAASVISLAYDCLLS